MAEETVTSKETIAGMDQDQEEKDVNAASSREETKAAEGMDADPGAEEAACEEAAGQDPDPEEAVDAEFASVEEGKAKGSFFKRKRDKRDEKIEELTDKVKRQMAEFDNFRKRTEKEKSQMFDLGARNIIEKILPVIDNFERGLAQAADQEDPFVQGMEKIYKSMLQELESIGVKPIEAEGKEFDPNLHNAVMHCEDDSVGENIVVQELQKGYTYHDAVVRHSMVKVAN